MTRSSNGFLFGAPASGKGPASRPEKGRECEEPGCATVLSTYNRSTTCYLHTAPTRRHALDRP